MINNEQKQSCHPELPEAGQYGSKRAAFTLAEVLITLGIIGVVAAMTIPTLMNKIQDQQFKIAYKKAYSDINNAFRQPIFDGELTRTTQYQPDATQEEFNIMKNAFKVAKYCGLGDYSCWAKGDALCGGTCSNASVRDENGNAIIDTSDRYLNTYSFIDASGRSWATYNTSECYFYVDTNGLAKPNQFGKDRFAFRFADKNGNGVSSASAYAMLNPFYNADLFTVSYWCKHPPCYYKSWLK